MLHNSRNQNTFAVADTVNLKLGTFHVLIYKNRIFNSAACNNFHVFFYICTVTGNNHILSAKNIAWSHQNRITKLKACFKCFNFVQNCKSLWSVYMQTFAKLFKAFTVFGKVNCIGTGSKNLYSLAVQIFCKLDCCTATKSYYYTKRLFYSNYIHYIHRCKRFKIKSIRCIKICRNCLGVVVYNCNLVTKLFEGTYTLNRRIIKLYTLSNTDWSGTQN